MAEINLKLINSITNEESMVSVPDDTICGYFLSKFIITNRLAQTDRDGNIIKYKLINKATGKELEENKKISDFGITNGDTIVIQVEKDEYTECRNCGAKIHSADKFCGKCGSTVINQTAASYFPFVENHAPISNSINNSINSKSLISLLLYIGGIISGIVSFIFGTTMFGKSSGLYEPSNTYGGDAYTGIQNAAAQTANNLTNVAEIAKDGIGYLLIAIGLISVFYFSIKLFERKQERE